MQENPQTEYASIKKYICVAIWTTENYLPVYDRGIAFAIKSDEYILETVTQSNNETNEHL